ncbi:MAG: LysR family substrate-binding domain-containing protein, partial [Rhodococcus sp. (in: high G+C Gram-positive bacteria)]
VADLVSTYRKLYPGVEVVVHRGTSAQTVDLVRSGAVDIAVVRPPLDDGDRELPLIVLDSEPILVAVPVDHPFGGRATLELGDLVDVPVVFWPEANAPGMYSRTLEQLWPNSTPDIVRFEADDEQVLHAVADGVGIAPIPQGRARMLRIPGIHLCEIAGEQPTLDVAVTYRPDNPNPALAPFVALAERERSSMTA